MEELTKGKTVEKASVYNAFEVLNENQVHERGVSKRRKGRGPRTAT